jgi:hypothetical protein
LQEKKIVAVKLGGQHREAPWISNFFLRAARQAPVHVVPINVTWSPFSFILCMLCNMPHVQGYWIMVIGCMVVPFRISPCCRCIYLLRLDVLGVVDSHQ